MKSNTIRAYELKNGIFNHAKLFHEREETEFIYAVARDGVGKTQVIHGWAGQTAQMEIVTCDTLDLHAGDRVVFATGRTAIVESWTTQVIDETQLQFIPYERADKVQRIVLQNLGV